jgi:cell division protein FtsI (penicillin-binding protein 3)
MKIPEGRRRFFLFQILTLVVLAAVVLRFAVLMLRPASREPAAPQPKTLERGPILDRNGKLLAMQTRLSNVSLWRPDIKSVDDTCLTLSPLLDIPAAELKSRIKASPTDFLYLKKRISQQDGERIAQQVKAGRLPGVRLEPVAGRVYPNQDLASHLLGFVGDDNIGWEGVEYGFQPYLIPSPTGNTQGKGAAGGSTVDFGNQVFLSIDVNAQYYLEKIADQVKADNDAEAVTLLAMDAKTGELLAYVAKPDFNPNSFSSYSDLERYDWPVSFSYEPGSVFKIFSLASIMQLGGINENSTFVCNGAYERTLPSGEKITIKCLDKHGVVTPEKIIEYSCNAGAGYASDTVDAANFYSMLGEFGFGTKTGIDLPGETAGYLQKPEDWSARTKPTIAMGQEMSASALQMATAATAIANKGMLMKPIIVRKVLSQDGTPLFVDEPQAVRQVVSPEVAEKMLGFMEMGSTESGTGWRAKIQDVRMSVKTGTAQIADPKTGRYSDTDYIASCLAILPTDDPQLIVYIMIYKPKGPSYLGGRIAAPPVRQAAEELVSYLGISRGKSPTIPHSGTITLPKLKALEIGAEMPDLTGVPKRLLVPLLMRRDISVTILGDGRVTKQNPPPGTPLTQGTAITLELR